jgi:hypothetical protein
MSGGAMMGVDEKAREASCSLLEHFGRPGWLTTIGVGSKGGGPALIVFLRVGQREIPHVEIPATWEGFPVVVRYMGPLKLCRIG